MLLFGDLKTDARVKRQFQSFVKKKFEIVLFHVDPIKKQILKTFINKNTNLLETKILLSNFFSNSKTELFILYQLLSVKEIIFSKSKIIYGHDIHNSLILLTALFLKKITI